MAFVPGHPHDLFLSYAHDESAWCEAFRKAVSEEFHVRTGRTLTFWQDARNLRTGQRWEDEIETAIREAAAFVAVVSPIYLNSAWCRRERGIVLENTLEALKVEPFYRFFKVAKTPDQRKAWETMLGLQATRFFGTLDEFELAEGAPEYVARVREIVRHIRELLTLMSNKGQEIYIAPGAIEMAGERDKLLHELQDRGYTIKPDTLLDDTYPRQDLLDAMDKVSHAIFVLGADYDRFTANQVEAATELGKPILFWIQPGPGQDAMRRRIDGFGQLPPGSEILGVRSIREMVPPLLEKLKPADPVAPVVAGNGANRVYINYDTTGGESHIAEQIAAAARQRNLEVLRPPDGDHARLMQSANALLLFRAARIEPDRWLELNAMELAFAGQIFQRQPDYLAKGLLVNDPNRLQNRAPGVPVYPYAEPFAPEILDPFFTALGAAVP